MIDSLPPFLLYVHMHCVAVDISVVLYHTMIPGFCQIHDWNEMTYEIPLHSGPEYRRQDRLHHFLWPGLY